MGQGVSLEAYDPSHVRIYANILSIKQPSTRANMIQTCLQGQEYVASAKRAGIYSFLLQYVATVQSGKNPAELPSNAFQQPQIQFQSPPKPQFPAQTLPAPIIQSRNPPLHIQPQFPAKTQSVPQSQHPSYNVPVKSTQNQVVDYQETTVPAWQQITETPKQKAVNYFSSCLEVLGIQEEIALTPEALKVAYKKAALKAHPDKGGNDQLFEAVTRAYAYLNEILLRVAGGRERGLKTVEAPAALESERKTESDKWQHVEPVRLNAKKLDMNAFNRMFEQTHIPDPDGDGYGDWLKSENTQQETPKFSGKFNRDVFNSMFQESSKKSAAAAGTNQNVILHPSAMALAMAPQLGTEIGRGRPDSFTAAANDKFKFTDLRDAYSKENTFSGQVADVRVEQRTLEQYRANRERAPDPYSATEMDQLQSSEAEVRRREELRQRRKAEQDLIENDYFKRMKQLVITNG